MMTERLVNLVQGRTSGHIERDGKLLAEIEITNLYETKETSLPQFRDTIEGFLHILAGSIGDLRVKPWRLVIPGLVLNNCQFASPEHTNIFLCKKWRKE
jgi:hypothetical protein